MIIYYSLNLYNIVIIWMHNISNYASICDIYHMDVRSFSVASCSSNSVYFISTSQNGWQLYREAKFFSDCCSLQPVIFPTIEMVSSFLQVMVG